jgi:hypothetical protein
MSSTDASPRRTQHPTSTDSRRGSATRPTPTTSSTSSKETSESTTRVQHTSSIQLDIDSLIPSATSQDLLDNATSTTTSSSTSSNTCSLGSDCASGARILDADPFGSGGGSSLAPVTHMSTGSAIGIGLGLLSFIILIFGFLIWLSRRRGRKPLHDPVEAPTFNRTRSASSATDQKTLVASLPNSPLHDQFREQHEQMMTASFAQLVNSNKIVTPNPSEKERLAEEGRASTSDPNHQRSGSTEKSLPLPPNDMPLPPPPPTEEKRYAINVNINKSMIFDDMVPIMAHDRTPSPRDSTTSRDRMPKYRFEEYLPPVAKTPPISLPASKRTSEIELKPYPRKDSSSAGSISDGEGEKETALRRKNTLKKLESKAPQLPLPDLLPPPSPSFSFKSYDWYQDIIGTEQTNMEDTIIGITTPAVPDRNPARTPTKATFGAALSSNPPDIDYSLMPQPLSPSTQHFGASHLHPNTALASPTNANFRLSPTVYTMPSRPPKAQPMRASLRSAMTQSTHMSRSWLPDDGLYLPEEGTHDSYRIFNKSHFSDDSRPTSYTPL